MNTSDDQSEATGGAAGSTLGALYAVIVTVIGIILPVIFFVAGHYTGTGLYLAIFHLYIYTVSLFFLLYIQICLLTRKRKKSAYLDNTDSMEFEAVPGVTFKDMMMAKNVELDPLEKEENTGGDEERNPLDKEAVAGRGGGGIREKKPSYSHTGEGVHFFLRLGVIVFGMGTIVLDGFRLLQFVESRQVWQCYGHFYLAHIAVRLVFVFAQTFFIFKNHKLVVNFSTGFVRFGLVHLIATNLCIWSMTVVMETSESYSFANGMDAADTTASPDGESEGPMFMNPDIDAHAICHKKKTLADQAAPYLYPCSIEFSIISAAILCRILTNVGAFICRGPRVPPDRQRGICHKANTGLFLGLIVLVLICISTCFFLLYKGGHQPLTNLTTMLVFAAGDIAVMALALLVLIIAFCKVCRLGTGEVADKLNQTVLFVGVAGYYLLCVCILVPSIHSLTAEELILGLFAKLVVVVCLLGCVQATAQVTFLVDGLRRRATTRHHMKVKPGRSLVTFLLVCNLAMWVIDSFQLKEIHSLDIFRLYYGNLAWQIMMHTFLPLAILFRFHSSVCFAVIWAMAYKKRQTRTVSFNESDENRM